MSISTWEKFIMKLRIRELQKKCYCVFHSCRWFSVAHKWSIFCFNKCWKRCLMTKWLLSWLAQNRARRLIECARHKDGWVCDWLDVRNLIKYDRLITTYKINNGLCQENLKNKFTPRSNISRYNTRKIDDFEIPRLRLEYCKKPFGYQGASAWNEIPKQIRDSASLSSFKVRLREFLR